MKAFIVLFWVFAVSSYAATNIIHFDQQEWPYCEEQTISFNVSPDEIYTNLSFLVNASIQPSTFRLSFISANSNEWIHAPLENPLPNQDNIYTVGMSSNEWHKPPWTYGTFNNDKLSITKFNLLIRRHGDSKEQNFEIHGVSFEVYEYFPQDWIDMYFPSNTLSQTELAELDSDGDGTSNYEEYIAGTIPTDSESVFKVVNITCNTKEIQLYWYSVDGKLYSIDRSTNLMIGFDRVVRNLLATPPVNMYIDNTATNKVPYFYSIEVK